MHTLKRQINKETVGRAVFLSSIVDSVKTLICWKIVSSRKKVPQTRVITAKSKTQ